MSNDAAAQHTEEAQAGSGSMLSSLVSFFVPTYVLVRIWARPAAMREEGRRADGSAFLAGTEGAQRQEMGM